MEIIFYWHFVAKPRWILRRNVQWMEKGKEKMKNIGQNSTKKLFSVVQVTHKPTTPQCRKSERIHGTKGEFNKGLRPIHTRGFAPGACSAPGSFCTFQYTRGSVFKFAQFAPGVCSQIFNRLNIVEHFAGWKFCSRGWSIPMKSLVHTEELCSRSVPLEHTPGTKSLVCIGLYTGKRPRTEV